ncbi:hypothetical protein EXIGLDRAFT_715840, partial [Exidia glandulosa HHB12029]
DYEYGHAELEAAPVKEYKLPLEEPDTEFKKAFPPDPLGHEMDDGARVWRVYREEAKMYDNTLLEGWSSTLDILLIFAGLFSAVATAFVIESYQLLQPDNAAYTAAALYILVAASNHSTGMTLPPPPDLSFASSLTRWVNGLWFTSILLSLAVALLSILVKQWITEYRARNNASAKSPRDWARRHQLYSRALHAWPVAEVVSFLPVLLHLSLFLFFAGVVAFLWGLDKAIGIWIIVLGASLAVFYAACTIAPLWIPECPTSTPLVSQLRKVAVPVMLILLRACKDVLAQSLRLGELISAALSDEHRSRAMTHNHPSDDAFALPISVQPPPPESTSMTIRLEQMITSVETLRRDKSAIEAHLEQQRDDLDASTLCWLIAEVSDSDAVAVGFQALGAIQPMSALADRLRIHDAIANFSQQAAYTRSTAPRSPVELVRGLRSGLFITPDGGSIPSGYFLSLYDLSEIQRDYPDIAMFRTSINFMLHNASSWCIGSPSLTSTAVHALRVVHLEFKLRLAYLLCCDLKGLSHADWDVVFTAIYIDTTNPVLRYPRLHCSTKISRTLLLADLLSHVALHSHDSEEHDLATELIPRLVTVARAVPAAYLSSLPFLLEFFASQRFLYHKHNPNEVIQVANLLCMEAAVLTSNIIMVPRFWRAVAVIGQITIETPNMQHALYILSRTCSIALGFCFNELALGGTLFGILGPSSVSPPIWTLLGELWCSMPYDMLNCAQLLAAALSLHARRHSIRSAALIDTYFAELDSAWVQTLATMTSWWSTEQSEPMSLRLQVVHFVQHCIELRPQWWLKALSHVQLGGSDDKRLMVLEIDQEVSCRGPCLRCPRVRFDYATQEVVSYELVEGPPPLGWRTIDTDCDDPSDCSFHP